MGKHQLIAVSPNKTIEGAAGGLACTISTAFIMRWLLGWPAGQGLTLVHYSAQLEPFLTQKQTLNTPNTPYHPLHTAETTPDCTPCHVEGA